MNIKKHIPNTITLGNLFCGCLAIIKAFEGDLIWAAYLVGIALILDFLDGFTARLLKVSSAIGKDLDSLADMVTFGVVPGIVAYKLLALSTVNSLGDVLAGAEPTTLNDLGQIANSFLQAAFVSNTNDFESYSPYLKYFALIIPILSCVRLAKFNNDSRQSDSFIGLPTPANAMVICSIPLIIQTNISYFQNSTFLLSPYFLCVIIFVFSLLLIAEIPLFALKFKNFGWADNKLRFVFLGVCLFTIILLKLLAIPLIIILYVIFSVINNLVFKSASNPKI